MIMHGSIPSTPEWLTTPLAAPSSCRSQHEEALTPNHNACENAARAGGPEIQWLHQILERADCYNTRGQLEVARDFLQIASDMAESNVDIRVALGSLEYQLGNYEGARLNYEKAAGYHPQDGTIQTKLAAACLKLGRTEDFQSAIVRAFEINPDDQDAMRLSALFLLEQQRYLQSARLYQRLLQQNPDDVNMLLGLGKCFYKLGDLESAQMVFERTLAVEPDNPIAREGLQIVKQTQPGAGPTPMPVIDCVESDASETIHANGAEPTHGTLAVEPAGQAPSPIPQAATDLAYFMQQADTEYARGNLAGACQALEKAIPLAPNAIELLETLGSLRYQLSDYPAAQAVFSQAIQLRPERASLHTKMAAVYQKLGDAESFELAIRQACTLAPDDVETLRLLANHRSQQGEYAEAARCCVKVLEQCRNDVDTLLLLGTCLYHGGDPETAQAAFEETLRIDPGNAIARENLEVVKHQLASRPVTASA